LVVDGNFKTEFVEEDAAAKKTAAAVPDAAGRNRRRIVNVMNPREIIPSRIAAAP